ncbi:MAG: HAMP domain-containing sensor histidine kinase [Planctomycetota bacterium]
MQDHGPDDCHADQEREGSLEKTDKTPSRKKTEHLHEGIIIVIIAAAMMIWALMSEAFHIVGDWIKGIGEFNKDTVYGLIHLFIFGLIIFLVQRWRRLKRKAKRFELLRDDLSSSEERYIESMNRMTAGVAHEINNPLAGIKNCMMLLRDAIPEDHKYFPYAGMIDKEIEHISEIVRKMLQLYHPRDGGNNPGFLSLSKAVQEVRSNLDKQLTAKSLRLNVDIPSDFPEVKVQREDFQQILHNLLLNAIQASEEGGEIGIRAREDENCFSIAVMDHGPGIAKEVLPNIFEPFFTTRTNEREKGLGLGLSLSRSLAIFMGGRITVKTQPGKGSTFVVELPQKTEKPIQRKV